MLPNCFVNEAVVKEGGMVSTRHIATGFNEDKVCTKESFVNSSRPRNKEATHEHKKQRQKASRLHLKNGNFSLNAVCFEAKPHRRLVPTSVSLVKSLSLFCEL
jgi:hypothetical protein